MLYKVLYFKLTSDFNHNTLLLLNLKL